MRDEHVERGQHCQQHARPDPGLAAPSRRHDMIAATQPPSAAHPPTRPPARVVAQDVHVGGVAAARQPRLNRVHHAVEARGCGQRWGVRGSGVELGRALLCRPTETHRPPTAIRGALHQARGRHSTRSSTRLTPAIAARLGVCATCSGVRSPNAGIVTSPTPSIISSSTFSRLACCAGAVAAGAAVGAATGAIAIDALVVRSDARTARLSSSGCFDEFVQSVLGYTKSYTGAQKRPVDLLRSSDLLCGR